MTQQIHYVTFRSCTRAEYLSSAKDEWSVYFLTDTHEIYRGTNQYGSSGGSIERLAVLPAVTSVDDGRIAVYTGNTTGGLTKYHFYQVVLDGTYKWSDITGDIGGSNYEAGTGIAIAGNAISISGAASASTGTVLTKSSSGVSWVSIPVATYELQVSTATSLAILPGRFYAWTVTADSQLSSSGWSSTAYQESVIKIVKDTSVITMDGIEFVKDETITFANAGTYYCKVYSWGGFIRLEIKEFRTTEEASSSSEDSSSGESSSSSEEASSSSEDSSSSSEVASSSSSGEESSSSGEDLSDFTLTSFDISGTTLTQLATGVDIADYSYNEDGLDLQVLPDGYKAISGASAGVSFPIDDYPNHIGIDGNGMLRMEDPSAEFSWVIDSDTTWAKVSGICAATFEEAYAYATKTDGTLWAINFYQGDSVIQQVGVDGGWTVISGYSDSSSNTRAFGICDGGLYHLYGTTATRIGISSSWTAVTGFSKSHGGNYSSIGFGIDAGNLYILAASENADPTASLWDSAGVWTKISGYGQEASSNGDYRGDFIWSTVYGIRDGSLMGVVGGYTYPQHSPLYTIEVIDSTRTYHDVWLMAAGTTSTESTGIAIGATPTSESSSSESSESESSSSEGLLTAIGLMIGYPDPSPYSFAIWSVDGGTTWNATDSTIQLPAGTYTITWGGAGEYVNAPASSSVTIIAGQETVVQGIYTI